MNYILRKNKKIFITIPLFGNDNIPALVDREKISEVEYSKLVEDDKNKVFHGFFFED